MSLKIKDATLIEELADYLMFAVGNTEGDTDGAVTLGQVKDYTDTDKALVAFTGSYLNLSDAPNLESYVLMDTLTQNYYNRNQVNQLIGGVSGPKFEKVEELPEQGENNVIYLIPDETAQQDNIFDEYIWIPDGRMFEKIGSTAADFENYYTIEEVDAMIPSVNNPTITFQQGGVTKGTITLNQSSASTINFDESFEQEQADWNQSNPAAADYIKNKPNIPVVNDTIMTISQGGVQKGIFSLNQEGPETIDLDAQVQADWDQEDNSEADYIKNKPETLKLLFTYEDNTSDLVDFYIKSVENIPDYFYIKNEYSGQNTITLTSTDLNSSTTKTLQYSKDFVNWTTLDLTLGTNTITLEDGEKVYFRNTNGKFNKITIPSGYTKFTGNKEHSVGGNICSLLNYLDMNVSQLPNNGIFYRLFYEDLELIKAEDLVMPQVTQTNCYNQMFYGCTKLLTPPQLPARTVYGSSYSSMFYNCTSLIQAPELPATSVYGSSYSYMFYNCTSLTTAPSELPATVGYNDSNYKYMFYNCTSLTTPPATISLSTLRNSEFREMFCGCINLQTAPYFNISRIESYEACLGMFDGCSSMVFTRVPELNAPTLYKSSYQRMFKGCSSITEAPAIQATSFVSYSVCESMFEGCTSLTTVPSLPTVTGEQCYAFMFKNCTSLVNPPSLPATNMSARCCQGMFQGCTSLTTAPSLPATTLAEGCYGGMFYNCSQLNSITIYADDISATNCINNWVLGVANTGTFHNLGSATYTIGQSGIPNGWTEVNS